MEHARSGYKVQLYVLTTTYLLTAPHFHMAKWGEGDPRWIVEDRPDATNVNNWHWYD